MMLLRPFLPLFLLTLSNIFMTWAWYGHLKTQKNSALWIVILSSWGIAFFEYCLQVPANRLGSEFWKTEQLKMFQEIISLAVFAAFSKWYLGEVPSKNYGYASLCMIAALYFVLQKE